MSRGMDLGAGKYQTSLLKAFQRTVDDARFAVVVVDAPNLRVEDVKPYWAAGQVLCAHDVPAILAMHLRYLWLPYSNDNLPPKPYVTCTLNLSHCLSQAF